MQTTLLLIGFILLVCGAFAQQQRSKVQNRTLRTTGTIVEKSVAPPREGETGTEAVPDYYVIVRYVTGMGEEREFQSRLKADQVRQLEAGSEVNVIYDPLNPYHVKVAASVDRGVATIATTICLMIGACFFLFGLISLTSH
jgi:hypothetical protein